MFTDGLLEGMSPSKAMFGMGRLKAALARGESKAAPLLENVFGMGRLKAALARGESRAAPLLENVVRACQAHVLEAPQFSDTTLVCFGVD